MIALKLLCVFSACVLLTYATEPDTFIVGGSNARRGQFPHMVSLRTPQKRHFCGAGLLSNRWLLSAGHCTQGQNSNPKNVVAWVGAHTLSDGVRYTINAIINHPRYNAVFLANDICVLRSAQNIVFVQGRIAPARLPTADYTDGLRVRTWIAGWGLTRFPDAGTQGVPAVLQFKKATTISRKECHRRLGSFGRLVHDNTLCTLTADGMGTCRGDSGGPLTNDRGAIVGIVSWGIPCATPHPDTYARVFPHRGFIRSATGL